MFETPAKQFKYLLIQHANNIWMEVLIGLKDFICHHVIAHKTWVNCIPFAQLMHARVM